MTVVPVNEIYVIANFKETQVGLLRAGQPVRLEVDALPDFEIAGRVESISPGTGAEFSILPPENATGNFTKIRSEEHTSELQSLMRISYAVFCLKKKKQTNIIK